MEPSIKLFKSADYTCLYRMQRYS